MLAVVSDNSNRNGGAEMGVCGAERISYNLISGLLLMYVPLLIFVVRYW